MKQALGQFVRKAVKHRELRSQQAMALRVDRPGRMTGPVVHRFRHARHGRRDFLEDSFFVWPANLDRAAIRHVTVGGASHAYFWRSSGMITPEALIESPVISPVSRTVCPACS